VLSRRWGLVDRAHEAALVTALLGGCAGQRESDLAVANGAVLSLAVETDVLPRSLQLVRTRLRPAEELARSFDEIRARLAERGSP
jgi:hypothetical protein